MFLLKLLLFLFLLFFLGFLITFLFKIKFHLIERISLSYLLGIGILTFLIFIMNYFLGLGFSSKNTFVVLLLLIFVLLVLERNNFILFFRNIRRSNISIYFFKDKYSLVFAFSIFILLFFSLVRNIYWPVSDWDALALYDFRAKVFLSEPSLLKAGLNNSYFVHYPLLTSLAHLFVYQTGLSNPKFIYSLFYLSFIFIFYFSLQRNVGSNKAVFFSLILALVPEIFGHSTMAYTNLPYTVYLCSGVFYLYEWIKNKQRSLLVLSGLLVGLSSWVRISEPFWMVPVLIVIFFSIKRKDFFSTFIYFFSVYVFYKAWLSFMAKVNFLNYVEGGASLSLIERYLPILKTISLERIILVAQYLYKNVFSSWGLLFPIFVLTSLFLFLNLRRRKKEIEVFYFWSIIFLFFIFLFFGTLLFSYTFPNWQHIPDSARRMSMFFIPLIIYYFSFANNL